MGQNTIFVIYGSEKKIEETKLMLPEDVLEEAILCQEINKPILDKIKKDYSTTRIAIIKAGVGLTGGFAEFAMFRRVNPGQIVTIPHRVALSNMEDEEFPAFTPSVFEQEMPEEPLITLNDKMILTHGVAVTHVLKGGWSNLAESVRAMGFEVIFDVSQATYQINEPIIEAIREVRNSTENVEALSQDIKHILSGEFVKEKMETIIAEESNQAKQRVEVATGAGPDPARKAQGELQKNAHSIVQRNLAKRARNQKVREYKKRHLVDKVKSMSDIPDDIRIKLNLPDDK